MPRSREQLQVLFAALDVAYRAMDGRVDAFDVDTLQSTAEEVIKDHSDPAFRAINAFATDFQIHRRDPVKLAELGDALRRFVQEETRPVPPDLHRKDIYG